MTDNSIREIPGKISTEGIRLKEPLVELTFPADDTVGAGDLDGFSLVLWDRSGQRLTIAGDEVEPDDFLMLSEVSGEELAEYRWAGYVFRKAPDPDSNFYQATHSGPGTLWIDDRGQRSLRSQISDGLLYRVCAGNIQPLTAPNRLARIDPYQILLDVDSGGGAVDVRIRAVHVLDGGTWRRGGVYSHCGDETDSYHLRVPYQDDCLDVFESYSSYFMGRSALHVLDM